MDIWRDSFLIYTINRIISITDKIKYIPDYKNIVTATSPFTAPDDGELLVYTPNNNKFMLSIGDYSIYIESIYGNYHIETIIMGKGDTCNFGNNATFVPYKK